MGFVYKLPTLLNLKHRLTELYYFKYLSQTLLFMWCILKEELKQGNLLGATWAEAMLEVLVFVVFLAASLLAPDTTSK